MSVALTHSPADITRWLLVALGLGSSPLILDPDTDLPVGAWPIYADKEPNAPDNCLTVYDTSSQADGDAQNDGEAYLHFGVQVRIRATSPTRGYAKAEAIRVALNERMPPAGSFGPTAVTLTDDDGNSHAYLVHCFSGTNLLRLGEEQGASRRCLYTVNAMLALTAHA